jgi:hypothetical protein
MNLSLCHNAKRTALYRQNNKQEEGNMFFRKSFLRGLVSASIVIGVAGCNNVNVDKLPDQSLNNSRIATALFGASGTKTTARYAGFEAFIIYTKSGNNTVNAADSIHYTGDTLVLEILTADSVQAQIREYISSQKGPHVGHQCTYTLTLLNDSLKAGNGADSSILTFARFFPPQFAVPNDSLPLITMETMFFLPIDSLNFFAKVQSIKVLDIEYPMLYGSFSLSELTSDGAACYVLYYPSYGIVRVFTYGLMFPGGSGWDLIR